MNLRVVLDEGDHTMSIPFLSSICRSSLLFALILLLPASGSTARTGLPAMNTTATATVPPLPGGHLMTVGLDRLKGWNRVRLFLLDPQSERLAALRPWVTWAQTLRPLPERKRLAAINARVDASIPYAGDEIVWHRTDYWEDPLEVVRQGRTDCEGDVALKMFLAIAAGIDSDHMAIVVGRVPHRGIFHAVLIVRVGAARYALDNLHQPSLSDIGRPVDFEPIYAVDMARSWSFPSSPAPFVPYVVAAP
jgi:predicted transglutaminase-like cysteine proteinase